MAGLHTFGNQVQRQGVRHFSHNQPRRVKTGRARKHLPRTHTMTSWLIRFDVGDRARFPTPRMVDKQLGVHTEHLVQQALVVILVGTAYGTSGYIAHCH